MNKIFKQVAVLFLAIYCQNALAALEDFSKTIQKTYTSSDQSSLEIINKYGNVNVQDWENNSIQITVKITVDQSTKAEADKLLSMVTINFSENGHRIKAETVIGDDFGKSHSWFGNHDGKNFSINYTINMPKKLDLKLTNKYGNIFINNLSGCLDLDLKYGNLNINTLSRGDQKPLNQIAVAYGKAAIDQCNWLKFTLSYSKASFQSCKALIVVSKYSKISCEQISSLVGESSYDGYSIGELSNLVITGKYGNFNFRSITKKIEADVKYSDFKVDAIPGNFEGIQIDNAYGKISLGIDPAASYEIDVQARYASVNFPDNGKISRISQNNETSVQGKTGNGTGKSKVTIKSSYGGVNLQK